jgi:HNH endonuclease
VLYDKIGPGEHGCHWCPRRVHWDGVGILRLVADHLDDDRWNNDPENLVSSCRTCNSNRAKRPDYFTHCEHGHAKTPENTYERPDGKGTMCRPCQQRRESERPPRRR